MSSKRRMTAVEFEGIRPFAKMAEDRLEIARLVLVEGQGLQEVGDRFGKSKQAVNGCIKAVWELLKNYQEAEKAKQTALPEGWQQVTLIAPVELVEKFQQEIDQIAHGARRKKPEKNRASKST